MSVEKILQELSVDDIICIGNSHSHFFNGIVNITPIDIGPALAFKLIQDSSTTNSKNKILNILNTTDSSKTAFILSFGEIDIRMFVVKRTEIENITLEESVVRVVEKYVEMIELIRSRGYKILIHGLHGAGSNYDAAFPYYGTMQQRNEASLIFNFYLENYCNQNKIAFTSLFDLVVNKETYETNLEYINDGCHLNIVPELQEIVLSRFLSKLKNL